MCTEVLICSQTTSAGYTPVFQYELSGNSTFHSNSHYNGRKRGQHSRPQKGTFGKVDLFKFCANFIQTCRIVPRTRFSETSISKSQFFSLLHKRMNLLDQRSVGNDLSHAILLQSHNGFSRLKVQWDSIVTIKVKDFILLPS